MTPEEYDQASDKNERIIQGQINELKEKYNDLFEFDGKGFWAIVKEVNTNFKTLKPLKKESRQKLWSEFQEYCELAKAKQKNQQSQFVVNSEISRNHIISMINTANMRSKVDRSGSNRMLGKAMDELKSAKLTKEDRETCWQRWKSVKDEINKEGETVRYGNYLKIKERIVSMSSTAVYGDAKQALDEIKSIQRDMKNHPMDDLHWKEVKSSLATYWDKAKARLDEHYREKKRNWEAKNSQWRSKQESALSKFESMISNSEDFIARRRSEISKLESDMYGGSDSFRSRASGWIAEKEADIARAQSQISDLEYKVRDIRNQLNK